MRQYEDEDITKYENYVIKLDIDSSFLLVWCYPYVYNCIITANQCRYTQFI